MKNIEKNLKEDVKVSSFEKKKYSVPTIQKIGSINKITLNGVNNPVADSGSNFTS